MIHSVHIGRQQPCRVYRSAPAKVAYVETKKKAGADKHRPEMPRPSETETDREEVSRLSSIDDEGAETDEKHAIENSSHRVVA